VSESAEQRDVVTALRGGHIVHAHIPNGGERAQHRRGGGRGMGARDGVVAGMPDLLVFDPPREEIAREHFATARLEVDGIALLSMVSLAHGTAMELKRSDRRWGHVTTEQREVLAQLHDRGWVVAVGYGACDALAKLLGLGYLLPTVAGPVAMSEWAGWSAADRRYGCPYCAKADQVVQSPSMQHVRACRRCRRSWGAVPIAKLGGGAL